MPRNPLMIGVIAVARSLQYVVCHGGIPGLMGLLGTVKGCKRVLAHARGCQRLSEAVRQRLSEAVRGCQRLTCQRLSGAVMAVTASVS